jgi:outer membrane protein OmpA-like peptidoglycan-associated protein
MKTATLLLAALLVAACSSKEAPAPQSLSSASPDDAPAWKPTKTASATDTPAEEKIADPEPPDAQARAEEIVSANFNRDKTTRLAMTMTSLVGHTSELSGFATSLVPKENKVEDRLARLGAKITETEVVIQLPGSILFDFDSANIRPDADRALDDVAQVIKAYESRSVRIEGHTDSVASDEYNQSLSERRAGSVADWFAKDGIERGRLAVAGHGEKKPLATNDTAAGRQLNRRVEVVINRKQ